MIAKYLLTVDRRRRAVVADGEMPLLYALRDLGVRGPKFGCGLAQCGACTVLLNDAPVRSCVLPLRAASGHRIRTLEGLGSVESPHPVQRAFIEEQAALCGYCTNGWIMTAVSRLERDPQISDAEIRQMWTGLKCRCGAHLAMLRAARRAADAMRQSAGGGESAAPAATAQKNSR